MKEKTIKSILEKIETDGLVNTSEHFGMSIFEIVKKCDLNYKTFEDINFEKHEELGGVVGRIIFENGFGASVVSHIMSYGGKLGLYELAVLDKNEELTYDTPVTNDVLGHLTPEEVTNYLIQIQDLKN
jgi:hypothetical protein